MTTPFSLLAAALLQAPAPEAAATCPCPPTPTPGWHGSAAAGLAATSGNSDTRSYNVKLTLSYDPRQRNLVKIDGFYLRSEASGEDTADKAAFGVRDELKLGRGFLFAETRYQRDRFKRLDYLLTPGIGAGYKLVEGQRLSLSVDGGVGLALEGLENTESTTDAALSAGESLSWQLSEGATLTQSASAIWKMKDFGDAFYHLEAALASSINSRLELRLTAMVDIKNRPPTPRSRGWTGPC